MRIVYKVMWMTVDNRRFSHKFLNIFNAIKYVHKLKTQLSDLAVVLITENEPCTRIIYEWINEKD